MKAVPERLQKVLAQRGYGSRREIEAWISAGQILVNGLPATLGCKVTDKDIISLNGKVLGKPKISLQNKHSIILYYKPEGQICTRSDPQGRVTVFSKLPRLQGQRWVAVGRLDINSSGLILFTTDGELAHKLMHPSANIEREYAVRVLGKVTKDILHSLQKGVVLDDGVTAKFKRIEFVGGAGANSWYNVTLTEGRYREVRRLWESQGVQVSRLIRIRFGNIKLPKDLVAGKYVELDYNEINSQFKNV
jgi:23S rRNA pseudouridine2605 synthase